MEWHWGDWEEHDNTSPYFHWADQGSGGAPFISDNEDLSEDGRFFAQARTLFRWETSKTPEKGFEVDSSKMVIPNYAANSGYTPKVPDDATLDVLSDIPPGTEDVTPLRNDTIIAGVIDIGIPLGHNRWRLKTGKTRLLYAWQMMAPWTLKSQAHLPFGAEFSEGAINGLLKKHSGEGCEGWLNEQDFNVDTGLISFKHRQAQRGAAGHSSHGAHVLDLVAGMDPKEAGDFQERVRIVAINAPTAAVFKAAGTHLDDYMFYAIQRIADIADAAWEAKHPNFNELQGDGSPAVKGFPIVINMSFGKQAGSKDALDEFPAKLARFVKQRELDGWSRVRFVMPAGNDNLSRCNAMLEPKNGAVKKLNWRILPQDHSANYVEIWGNNAGELPVTISLKSPHSKALFLKNPNPNYLHQYRDLCHDNVLVARVYLSHIALDPVNAEGADEKQNKPHQKYRYVLCTAPTHWANDVSPEVTGNIPPAIAPSGLWEIAIHNRSNEQVQTVLSVQTDQALSASDGVNLRSYFDDPGYERFGENGAELESYSFPPNSKKEAENLDIRANSPVRRHGTMNASAAHAFVARVGGYRVSDGRPAPYSATGRGRERGQDDGTVLGSLLTSGRKGAPTAAFPTEDSPAHFGILAAGAADGSVAAMRGTSFASAQGARVLIKLLMRADNTRTENKMLYEEAKLNRNGTYSTDMIEVLGGGTIDRPDKQNMPRF